MGTMMKTMLTEADNETYDIFRYLALLSILVALGLEIYVVTLKGQAFDFQNFGIGTGTLFTGAGIALKLKPEAAVEKAG